jgi:hypothetical protein
MKVHKTGDWALARKMLTTMPFKLRAVVGTALRQEAQKLRTEIVQGITKQAPGGKKFKDLSPLTLAARRLKNFKGTKALIVKADLRNAIAAIVRGHEAFVGVPRKARDKEGNPMVDVAKLNEFGSDPIVIPITPAMRKFLAVLFREAGSTAKSKSGNKSVAVTRIPPRPFLRPAFDKFSKGASERFLNRIATQLGLRGALR